MVYCAKYLPCLQGSYDENLIDPDKTKDRLIAKKLHVNRGHFLMDADGVGVAASQAVDSAFVRTLIRPHVVAVGL